MIETPKYMPGNPEDGTGLVLQQMRLRPMVYGRAELSGPWGFRVPEKAQIVFHCVVEGRAWLDVDGHGQWLGTGDCVLLLSGLSHSLGSRKGVKAIEMDQLLEHYMVAPQVLRYGAGEERTLLVCGEFEAQDALSLSMVTALPGVILQRANERPEIVATIELIAMEARRGDGVVVERLSEVLFLQMLRSLPVESLPKGWMLGLQDSRLARVLGAVHRDPVRDWNVEEMAELGGFSRSAFHGRFVELLGRTPMEYVSEWRLGQAERLLRHGNASVSEVADRVGYRSEAAFSRSFKRYAGVAPGSVRRVGLREKAMG